MDIVFVFINVISKYLLALFIDGVYVIDDNHLFFAINGTLGLTEDFHFIPVIIDALFFQIIDKENIDFGNIGGGRQLVVFTNETI
jgi:hypothetical protein